MPLFFFHVHDGQDLIDYVGLQRVDLDAARRHAIAAAGELFREEGRD